MIYLDGKISDIEPDPAKHKYIGEFRQPYKIPQSYILCTCGSMLTYQEITYDHYKSGHFDISQYQSLEAK